MNLGSGNKAARTVVESASSCRVSFARRVFYYGTSHNIMNAQRWTGDSAAPVSLSFSRSTTTWNGPFPVFDWQGPMDRVSRANSSLHYIGQRKTPVTGVPVGGIVSGMVDGESVDFDPIDLNEADIVVGSRGSTMVIRTPDSVAHLIDGIYPVAINDHTRPAANATPAPGASPTPTATPIPAPQILGWDGNATVVWERQADGQTWQGFGLEEMIPSMDGWEIWDITDMNDDGVIVGTGNFKDPNNAQAQGESHGFMLVPMEILEDTNDDKTIDQNDRPIEAATFGLWNEAYDSSGNVRNGNLEANNFVGSDKKRFYFRVMNPLKNTDSTAIDSFQVEWYTTKFDGTDEDRPAGKLTLRETGINTGVFVSKGVMLVTDDTDAQQVTNDGSGNMCARGTLDHRIRKASIDGCVNLKYSPSGTTAAPDLKVPVFDKTELRRLTLNIINYTAPPTNGAPGASYATPDYISGQVSHARDRWAQLGLKIETSATVQRPMPPASLDGTGNYAGTANSSQETILLNDLIPITADNTVTVVFVPLSGANAYTTVAQRTTVSLGNRFFIFIARNLDLNDETLAHELFHALYNRFDVPGVDRQFFTFNTNPPGAYGLALPDVRVYRRIHGETITPQNWLTTKRTRRFPIDSSIGTAGPSTGNTLITNY